jgi:hypothetical protein
MMNLVEGLEGAAIKIEFEATGSQMFMQLDRVG